MDSSEYKSQTEKYRLSTCIKDIHVHWGSPTYGRYYSNPTFMGHNAMGMAWNFIGYKLPIC